MRISTAMAGAVVVAALAAGGCSSGEDDGGEAAGATSTSVTPATTVDPAAVGVAEEYLEALTADDGPDVDAMTERSAPDSVAERYAVHTAALAELQAAAGEPAGGGEVRVEGDTVSPPSSAQGARPSTPPGPTSPSTTTACSSTSPSTG